MKPPAASLLCSALLFGLITTAPGQFTADLESRNAEAGLSGSTLIGIPTFATCSAKITNNLGNWGFFFRVTDNQGATLTNVKFSLSPD